MIEVTYLNTAKQENTLPLKITMICQSPASLLDCLARCNTSY